MKKLSDYKLIVYDCDGVILNSNRIKTEAFGESVSFLGSKAASIFKNYHIQNGGISRYEKFQHFIESIVPDLGIDYDINLQQLLETYSKEVALKLMSCEIDESIFKLKDATPSSSWAVASGSDQEELRNIFTNRDLTKLFELGIWGSPSSKQEIFKTHFRGYAPSDILFLGDSLYDYKVSKEFKVDFAFITHWSEFKEIIDFSKKNQISAFTSLETLYKGHFA